MSRHEPFCLSLNSWPAIVMIVSRLSPMLGRTKQTHGSVARSRAPLDDRHPGRRVRCRPRATWRSFHVDPDVIGATAGVVVIWFDVVSAVDPGLLNREGLAGDGDRSCAHRHRGVRIHPEVDVSVSCSPDPSATAIHASLLTAVQAHPEAVLTSTFTSDRSGPTVRDVGSMLLLHSGAAPS